MKYRVRQGYRHGAQRQWGPGDVLELTEQEAAGFLDKLEPVAEDIAPAAPVMEPAVEKPKRKAKAPTVQTEDGD